MGPHLPLLLSIPTLLPSWVFLYEKAYQVRDTAIESSVVTKVKGFGRYANRVMDVSDYVTPPQVWSPPTPESLCRCPDTGQVEGEGTSQGGCPQDPQPRICGIDDAERPLPSSWKALG